MNNSPRQNDQLWAIIGKFASVGLIVFVFDITIYSLLIKLNLSPVSARLFAFWLAVVLNWLLNRTYTFKHRVKESKSSQLSKFVMMSLTGFAINYGCYYSLMRSSDWLAHYHYLPFMIGIGMGTLFNFSVANWLIFKPKD